MDVTKYNFYENVDSVLESIEECSFMAIDGEFTGLDARGFGNGAPFDTPAERYFKLRNGSSDFLLIQFGLCTFTMNAEKQKYDAKPYNFYVFPRPAYKYSPDRRFLCQSSSIDFLCSQGFDFNKLFREGIPYLTPEQSSFQRRELEHKHSEVIKQLTSGMTSPMSSKHSPVPVPPEQQPFVDNICSKIDAYLKDDEMEPLTLSPCNAFQRKLIYQSVDSKYPMVQVETLTGEKKERYIVINKAKNSEDRLKKELDKQATEKMDLDIQIGFTKIIEAITQSGKLVVGHNMMLDVLHVVNQFHSHLPEDLDGFKAVVNSVLPRLLDTKLMASTAPFKEHINFTGLEDLKQTLQEPPFSRIQIDQAEGFDRYKDGSGSMHEAGFDALVTGSCFTSMVQFLGQFQASPEPFLSPTSKVVEPFVNKLFLMRIQDIPYLNLSGPDLEPSRPHVFHVTFPEDWKTSDLYSLFQPYGTIQISWQTETTAFVGLHKKDNAEIALTGLSSDPTSPYKVVTYAAHMQARRFSGRGFTPHCSSRPSPATVETKQPLMGKRKLSHGHTDEHSLDASGKKPKISKELDTTFDDSKNSSQIVTEDDDKAHSNHGGAIDDGDGKDIKKKLFEECASW